MRSEEHTSELQSLRHLVCRLLLEKKKNHAHTTCTRNRRYPTDSTGPGSAAHGARGSSPVVRVSVHIPGVIVSLAGFFFFSAGWPPEFPFFPPRPLSRL